MDPLTWSLIVIVCWAIYYYFKRKLSYFEDLGIPYAPGWPLLGSMAASLLRRKHMAYTMLDMYNKHPAAKYIGAFDMNRPVVLLRDPELIKSIAIKNFDNFPQHRVNFDESLDPLMANSLFSMNGERWKEARSLLSPTFTSSKIKGMFGSMSACAKSFVGYLGDRPESFVATKELFTKYTNDAMAICAFGVTVDSSRNPNNDFYTLGRKATSLEGANGLKFSLAQTAPFILKLFKISFLPKHIDEFFKNIVARSVRAREEEGSSPRPDMIQLMMDARSKDSKHFKLDEMHMTAQAFSFFFGGFDTTSTQMCLMAHELALNLRVQTRLQEEIDRVLEATGGEPTYEAINDMAYLDAVFNESMRLHTQAALLDRLCVKSFELPPALPDCKPFTVTPGMNVWIAPIGINRDPNFYDNPDVFDPDRYFGKKVSINDVANMNFGIGPRSCIGNRLAVLASKILFFHLLAKFNLRPNEKTCDPLKYSKEHLSLVAEGGFWLAMEPRNVQ